MHIITTITKITEYLPGLMSVVPKRPTHAVLATIYLETIKEGYKEGILLRATDLSAFLEVFIPCDVKKPGSVCIPAKLFSDIITGQSKKKLASAFLELSSDEENLIRIVTDKASQKLQGISSHEMPEAPKQENAKTVKLNGVQFCSKCDLLSKYCSTDQTKLILQTIQFSHDKLVATDGHKIAFATIKTNEEAIDFSIYPAMISTLKKLNFAKKLADLECEDIGLLVEDNYPFSSVFIEFANWKLTWRSGENGKDFSSVGIRGTTTTLEVDRADLIAKLKASVACSDQNRETKLWLHSQAGRLYLVANSSKDSLETEITDPVSFIVNAENLLSIVESLKVKVVKLILPQFKDDKLMGVEVDGVNVCLAERKRKEKDDDILNTFLEKTEFISTREIINKTYQEEIEHEPVVQGQQTSVAVLEPVANEPTIEDKVRGAIAHLQSLLANVTDVQMREAIVKEVMAVV